MLTEDGQGCPKKPAQWRIHSWSRCANNGGRNRPVSDTGSVFRRRLHVRGADLDGCAVKRHVSPTGNPQYSISLYSLVRGGCHGSRIAKIHLMKAA